MRTRRFWRKRSIFTEFLVPFSVLWFFWQRWRDMQSEPRKLSVPVICIGNITAGGAGKTPVALAVARMLAEKGRKPAFISRGYGGRLKGPVKVDTAAHGAGEVGDEPLLLARVAPCYIARKRAQAAELAMAEGADVLVMDDGMQNHSLSKDLTLVVVDGAYGFGNRLLLPAGPLRDRADIGLKKAQAAVVIGRTDAKVLEIINKAGLPVHWANLVPAILPDSQQPYVAFAGIGLPDKFFMTLKTIGTFVVKKVPFADHHPYSAKDVTKLRGLAEAHKAKLITTEKDAVRLPPEFRAEVEVLPVTLEFEEPEALRAVLGKYLP
jgi:tetraacyldisaccharide 4'-kinase